MSREKTNRVIIYKVKPHLHFDSLDFTTEGYSLLFSDVNHKLFVQRGKISTPSWVRYIEPLIIPELRETLFNSNCSFLFVIRHNASNYILSGGYGFTEIQDYVVLDFGLDLALRMINEKEILALNQKSMKGTTRQIIRAVAGYDPLFDRDNYTRILNTIEGKANFEEKKFRIIGKSSLALRTAKDINHIGEVLTQIEEILTREERVHFPKSYKEVKVKERLDQLEALMFASFQGFWRGDTGRENIYLEFKDPFAQFRCEKFNVIYKHHKADIEDFDLDLVRNELVSKGFNSIDEIEDLHRMFVTGLNDAGIQEIKKEPVYNLLVFESTLDNIHYIKLGKQWFQILEEVQDFINKELSHLIVDSDRLPEWNKTTHPTENSYNKFVAEQKNWECLDQDFVYIAGRSKIEFCDLYDSSDKTFFHIKETWGCKSAYLFTQGITAVESYRQSSVFRTECAKKWPRLFTEEIIKANLVFGIADNKAFADDFPMNMSYFAKLNLYNAVSLLKQYDFVVSLAPIKIF